MCVSLLIDQLVLVYRLFYFEMFKKYELSLVIDEYLRNIGDCCTWILSAVLTIAGDRPSQCSWTAPVTVPPSLSVAIDRQLFLFLPKMDKSYPKSGIGVVWPYWHRLHWPHPSAVVSVIL